MDTHPIQPERTFTVKKLGVDLLLLAVSALLFSLSFPSFLSTQGFSFLAYISLFPIFVVVRRNNWLGNILLGFLYGYGAYAIFNFWLTKFHPLAHIIVPVIFAAYFLALFPVLKLADVIFPKRGYLVQFLVWMGYEYLRTLGFLGYSYGIMGYSQYTFLPLIRIASVTGVWGVSALVIFPSVYIGAALKTAEGIRSWPTAIRRFFGDHRIAPMVYVACFLAVLIFGFAQKTDFSDQRQWRVALIQQNVDPWKGKLKAYTQSFEIHTRLSTEVLEKENPDIVVWSETAFVPGIDWHTRYRTNQDSFRLVKRLREYLDQQTVPFVIGNDDGQLARPGLPPVNADGTLNRLDYNAAILYINGEIIDTYRKLHLVPFTEGFPFKESLPGIYNWLKAADTHFWEEGDTYTVFEADGVKFSTPICFEDTFGYLSRQFVRNGAQVIVNMTNDSWSKSVASEMQHMSISIFRAVENRRTLVRSTNGGITCTVAPDGTVTAVLEPFTEAYLANDVPIYDETTTLYTKWGDWLGILFAIAAAVALVAGSIVRLLARRRS